MPYYVLSWRMHWVISLALVEVQARAIGDGAAARIVRPRYVSARSTLDFESSDRVWNPRTAVR